MPQKSTIKTLPAEVLATLNNHIAEGRLTIDDLVDWLDDAGHPKSRSAVGRHAQSYKQVARHLRESRQITDALAKELGESASQGKQGRLLVEMTRSMVFDLLVKLQGADKEEGADNKDGLSTMDVQRLGKGLADLGKALRLDQDFENNIRERIAQEEREKAAKVAGKAIENAGLSSETIDMVQTQILGMKK